MCPEYLYVTLQSIDYAPLITGTNQPLIRGRDLASTTIDLPPLEEQLRITDLLHNTDRVIKALGAARDALAHLRTAKLADFLSSPKEHWQEGYLRDFTDFAGGAAFPTSEQGRESGDFPFYKVSDMNTHGNETYLSTAVNWIDDDQRTRLGAKIWPAGTVVFPKVGAALKTEKRRLLSRPSAFDNNVMGLIPRNDVVLPRFLLALMQTMSLGSIAQEGAVPSVNQRIIGGINVVMPGLDEQRQIADLMEAFDAGIVKLNASESSARVLRHSLLSALTSGGHRIPKSYDQLLDQTIGTEGLFEVAAP